VAVRFTSDLSGLEEDFSYDRVTRTDRRIYFLFVNGRHVLVDGPYGWNDPRFGFQAGSGSITQTFQPSGGFHLGDRIRTEIYVQGNLRSVCELKVAVGPLPQGACAATGGGRDSLSSAPGRAGRARTTG
jgi:hypothetical protein